MTAATRTRTARTTRASVPAQEAGPGIKTRQATAPAPAVTPAKPKSHRQLVGDATAAWQQENQQALTIVAHLSGTATSGSVWKVRTEAGEEKRAQFTAENGTLRLVGFEDAAKGTKSTRAQIAEVVANLGKYEVVQHSTGSIWTVKDPAGKLYSYDRKEGTLTEKPAKKAPATPSTPATAPVTDAS
jgi:hypothetical protein